MAQKNAFKTAKFPYFLIKLPWQVRESDPETGREEIVIDADPLALLNDPELQDLLTGSATGSSADEPSLGKLVEWVGWIMLKILELAAEVLM